MKKVFIFIFTFLLVSCSSYELRKGRAPANFDVNSCIELSENFWIVDNLNKFKFNGYSDVFNHYQKFVDYSDGFYQKFSKYSPEDQEFITQLSDKSPMNWSLEDIQHIKRSIRDRFEDEKTQDEILSMFTAQDDSWEDFFRNVEAGLLTDDDIPKFRRRKQESYQQKFAYYFWIDHGPQHVRDILSNLEDVLELIPNHIRKDYSFIKKEKKWYEIMELAVYFHDAKVYVSRNLHAEFAFSMAQAMSKKKLALHAGVVAAMHSKSALPYEKLLKWEEMALNDELMLGDELLLHFKQRGVDISDELEESLLGLNELKSKTSLRIIRAGHLIRMADANRPIGVFKDGKGAQNSIGHKFIIDEDENIFLEKTARDGSSIRSPMLVSQKIYSYGNTVLSNLKRTKVKGQDSYVFKYLPIVPDSVIEVVRSVLDRDDIMELLHSNEFKNVVADIAQDSPKAASLLDVIHGVLADFPPRILKGHRVILKSH